MKYSDLANYYKFDKYPKRVLFRFDFLPEAKDGKSIEDITSYLRKKKITLN